MRNKWPKILLTLLLISLPFPLAAQEDSETVFQRVMRTRALRVGIREDAAPFGYRDINDRLAGVCLDYIYHLRDRLKEELDLNIITVFLIRSTLFNRYYLVEEKVVDIECGPNTIKHDLDRDVTFSTPFFITQIQFLVRSERQAKIDLSSNLANVGLGVLRYSTTQFELESRYPEADIQIFQGHLGRRRGVQAVQSQQIDAFASDGVLLLGEAIVESLPLGTDYALISAPNSACEFYGLILPKDDPEWENFVNSWVGTQKAGDIIGTWVSLVLPYLRESVRTCLPH